MDRQEGQDGTETGGEGSKRRVTAVSAAPVSAGELAAVAVSL